METEERWSMIEAERLSLADLLDGPVARAVGGSSRSARSGGCETSPPTWR